MRKKYKFYIGSNVQSMTLNTAEDLYTYMTNTIFDSKVYYVRFALNEPLAVTAYDRDPIDIEFKSIDIRRDDIEHIADHLRLQIIERGMS